MACIPNLCRLFRDTCADITPTITNMACIPNLCQFETGSLLSVKLLSKRKKDNVKKSEKARTQPGPNAQLATHARNTPVLWLWMKLASEPRLGSLLVSMWLHCNSLAEFLCQRPDHDLQIEIQSRGIHSFVCPCRFWNTRKLPYSVWKDDLICVNVSSSLD
jgi:hypothetical protein